MLGETCLVDGGDVDIQTLQPMNQLRVRWTIDGIAWSQQAVSTVKRITSEISECLVIWLAYSLPKSWHKYPRCPQINNEKVDISPEIACMALGHPRNNKKFITWDAVMRWGASWCRCFVSVPHWSTERTRNKSYRKDLKQDCWRKSLIQSAEVLRVRRILKIYKSTHQLYLIILFCYHLL